jgi:glutamate-1-semialdehyde 2,1-aminomutase
MALVAPEGPVYQAGTYSGNPLAMAAGLATLLELERDPSLFARLEARTGLLAAGLREALGRRKIEGTVNQVGSMWTIFFGVSHVETVPDARRADTARYARFFHAMLERGIYLPPSAFESAFLSTEHGEDEVDRALEAAHEALGSLA